MISQSARMMENVGFLTIAGPTLKAGKTLEEWAGLVLSVCFGPIRSASPANAGFLAKLAANGAEIGLEVVPERP